MGMCFFVKKKINEKMKHHCCHPPSEFDMLLFSNLIKLLNLHILIDFERLANILFNPLY